MVRVRPDFERQIGKAGMSKTALTSRAGIAKATLHFITPLCDDVTACW